MEFNNGVLEISFENDGKKKSVGWRMKPNKAATFERLLQLTENAEYAYSEINRDANEATSIPYFHYFIGDVVVGGHNIPVKIQVRDIVNGRGISEARYYTHNLLKNIAGGDSPVAGTQSTNIDSNAYAPAVDRVSQPVPNVNTEGSTIPPDDSTGAAPKGFSDNPNPGPEVESQNKPVTTSRFLTDDEKLEYNPAHERINTAEQNRRADNMFAVYDDAGEIRNWDEVAADLMSKDAWTATEEYAASHGV